MTPRKKYSLATIAAELGVSKSAVSFVLNGTARSRRIGAELEQRILDFCRQVNYRPNIHAQRMNGVHINNIGVLLDRRAVSYEISPFREYNIANVIGGVAEAAAAAGYRFSCQFYSADMSDDVVFDWIENKEIGGLIYYGLVMPERWVNDWQLLLKNMGSLYGVSFNKVVPALYDETATGFGLSSVGDIDVNGEYNAVVFNNVFIVADMPPYKIEFFIYDYGNLAFESDQTHGSFGKMNGQRNAYNPDVYSPYLKGAVRCIKK